jgi:hypothetical protein
MPATVRSKTLAELYIGLGYSGELPGQHHGDLDAVLQHCNLDILSHGSPHPFNKPDSKEANALARQTLITNERGARLWLGNTHGSGPSWSTRRTK